MRLIDEIIVHTTATRPGWMADKSAAEKVKEIWRWHVKDNGWSDIGYHFLIDRDGSIVDGRPIERVGAGVKGHNKTTVHIALIGGFGSAATDQFEKHYTVAQDLALRRLIDKLQERYPTITKVSGHNEYAAKACPGFQVRDWFERRAPRSPVSSRTLQGAGAAGAAGAVATGITATSQMDPVAQYMVIGLLAVVLIGAVIVFRERLRKWAAGIR